MRAPYEESAEARRFVEEEMDRAQPCDTDLEVMQLALQSVTLDGFYLEMGVYQGRTIEYIAQSTPHKTIYGFDSFEGLPEPWVRGDKIFAKELFAFTTPDYLPPVPSNVRLIKGWFSDTLPLFKSAQLGSSPIAFLHIDSDLYSSARDIFHTLGDNIVPGTIILFDELYNYPGFEEHELKALRKFCQKDSIKISYIAYNRNHEQVALKVISR